MSSSVRLAPSQIDFLDFVRAAAAQAVLIGHTSGFYLAGGFNRDGRVETFGVLVFFLISGFLITSSVLQKWERPDYDFGHYAIDRFSRIFVAYLPALIFVALVDSLLADSPAFPFAGGDRPLNWIGSLLMMQDYPVFQILRRLGFGEQPWFIQPYGSGQPFWTVSIEWWIYLFFGYFVFFVLRRRRFELRDAAIMGALGVVPIYNAMGGVGQCLTFVWAIGSAIAVVQDRLRRRGGPLTFARPQHWAFWCVALMALCAVMIVGRTFAIGGVQVYDLQFAIFTAGILFGAFFALGFAQPVLPTFVRRLVAGLAAYSYSLYLVHFTVLLWFVVTMPSATKHEPMMLLTVVVAGNVVAIAFWFAFERHYPTVARLLKATLDRRLALGRTGAAVLSETPVVLGDPAMMRADRQTSPQVAPPSGG